MHDNNVCLAEIKGNVITESPVLDSDGSMMLVSDRDHHVVSKLTDSLIGTMIDSRVQLCTRVMCQCDENEHSQADFFGEFINKYPVITA